MTSTTRPHAQHQTQLSHKSQKKQTDLFGTISCDTDDTLATESTQSIRHEKWRSESICAVANRYRLSHLPKDAQTRVLSRLTAERRLQVLITLGVTR